MTTRYDDDFYAWTQYQAALLRAEKFPDLDITNIDDPFWPEPFTEPS